MITILLTLAAILIGIPIGYYICSMYKSKPKFKHVRFAPNESYQTPELTELPPEVIKSRGKWVTADKNAIRRDIQELKEMEKKIGFPREL